MFGYHLIVLVEENIVHTMAHNETVTPQNYYNGSYIKTAFNEQKALIAAQGPEE
jgi:protein tyrosine phosphatase